MLIETLPAAFEMDEILWELREHSAGLNCGRWDYIFSLIKTLREDPNAIMPDRSASHANRPVQCLKCDQVQAPQRCMLSRPALRSQEATLYAEADSCALLCKMLASWQGF